jgi:hypothetical protein
MQAGELYKIGRAYLDTQLTVQLAVDHIVNHAHEQPQRVRSNSFKWDDVHQGPVSSKRVCVRGKDPAFHFRRAVFRAFERHVVAESDKLYDLRMKENFTRLARRRNLGVRVFYVRHTKLKERLLFIVQIDGVRVLVQPLQGGR